MKKRTGAHLVVDCLEAHAVEYVFVVPGAAIDPILDVLVDRGPKIILCHHELMAAFMAGAYARMTGKIGVCMATAGPGLTNLVTGLATATSERYPILAITGQVGRHLRFKGAHQNTESVDLLRPVTKWSVSPSTPDVIPDLIANAMRTALTPKEGAVHISFPYDDLTAPSTAKAIGAMPPEVLGLVDQPTLRRTADIIHNADRPVAFLGMAAAKETTYEAVRYFLKKMGIPVAATFEAAGVVSRELLSQFMGRLGVFRNQPGDKVLAAADLVITIGYDPVEYDPDTWNKGLERPIIHIGEIAATITQNFAPTEELIGDIPHSLTNLIETLNEEPRELDRMARNVRTALQKTATFSGSPVHPLHVIDELRAAIDDDVTVISDVGAHQYWVARNFECFRPRYFLTSMGFQSMGISIPWAVAATLARPGHKVVSISGDGSFLMCSMELETAVRLKSPIIHMVWEDGSYNLVKIQQEQKYGRSSAVHFGAIDTVKYAEAMGATAFRIETCEEVASTLEKALTIEGPVVLSIAIDYSENRKIVDVH